MPLTMSEDSKSTSEQLKNEGNRLYGIKKYGEACALYERASVLAPDNYILYNNIAAAKLALKAYDEAIANAKKAIQIQDNAKSHARIGTALLAQRKTVQAKKEFQIAAVMDPQNESVKSQLAAIEATELQAQRANNARYGLPPPLGGEFVSVETGSLGIILALIIISCSVICFVGSFFRLGAVILLWKVLLLCTMGQQLLIMNNRGIISLRPMRLGTFVEWTKHHSTLLFILSAAMLFSRPHYLVGSFIGLYSAVDIAARRAEVLALLPDAVVPMLAPRLLMLEEKQVMLRLSSGSFEAFTLLSCIVPSGSFLFPVVYMQYIRYRVQRDVYVQLAFKALKLNIEKITRSSYAPPFVDRLFQKLCDILSSYAQVG